MAISKIILNGVTQMDLTQDTVTAAHLETSYTAHGANGQPVTGSLTPGGSPNLQAKTGISPTTSSQTITADSGYDGLSSVQINAAALQGGQHDFTPTETAQTATVSPGTGYIGLSSVEVNCAAISSSYVGSGITRRSSSDLTASGATVTAPAGYYASAATKTISSGSATPAETITGSSATIVPGTNTLTLSKNVSNTPQVTAGYIASGTAGNTTVSLTANITTKSSATIHPSASNQTIAGGTYLTGTQTINAVTTTNLTADNIKSGVVVQVGDSSDSDCVLSVTGTYEGGGSSGMQIATKTTTLDSASTSISFSGLSGEPTSFAITTASDLATGASPWKTAAVTFDGTSLNGQIVTNTSNAQASHSTSFSKSYSNGTLTVTGSGTNFQANQYKLVYTYGGNSANLGTDDVQVGSGATSISFTGLSAEPDYFSIVFTSNFGTSSGYQRVMAVVYDGNSTYGVAMDSGAKALSSWSHTYNNGTLTVSSTGTNNGGYFHQPGDYHLAYGIGGTVEPVEIDVQPLSVTQNGTYTAPDGVAYSPVTVNVSGGGSANVATTTWTNSSTSTVSHQFTGLSGTPKAAFLRCTSQLTRSSNNTYYYIADIVWDGTNARGNYHLRSNGSYNDVPSTATAKYNVTVGTNSITFSSTASSRSSAPGSFYNGTYELTYIY